MKIFIFFSLFVGIVEGLNISCPADTCSEINGTAFCSSCNVSMKLGKDIDTVCNTSLTNAICTIVSKSPTHWWNSILNVGSVVGWVYLGIRAVVKSKLATPREEYMRSCFQGKVLSSEWLSLVMTTPSIISIFSNASWGGYLINGFPLTVAVGQLVYDSYKLVRSRRKDHRVKIFIEFINELNRNLDAKNYGKLTFALYEWACDELHQLTEWYGETEYRDFLTRNSRESLERVRCYFLGRFGVFDNQRELDQ